MLIDNVINELESLKYPYIRDDQSSFYNTAIDDAIEIVKQYDECSWILCSKELPKLDANYLVSVSKINPTVSVDYFDTKHSEFDSYADVVAWKPLQQPYKSV